MKKLVLNEQDLEKPINPDVKSQQAEILTDVEDKNIGVGNVAYSDAVKDVKKAGEMAAKANKVPQAEEHKEKGENPKMVPGAKKLKLEKLTLDESLFNDDSENDREMPWDYGKHFDDEEEDGIPYDRRAVEQEYGLEEGELDGVSLADAEQIVGEEDGALDRFIIQDEAVEEPKVDVERCKDILNNWIDWEPIDNYEADVDYAIEQLRSLESEHEITSDEYDYIMSNWDDLLNLNESLKENLYHFEFTSGSNPYLAKTEKERDRILKKYGDKVKEIKSGFYKVDDKSLKEDTESFRDEVKKYYDAYRKGIITSSEYGKKFKELKKKHNVKQSDLKDWKNLDEARVSKTKEVAVLQGNYGYGWDDLIEYDVPSIRDYEEYKKVTAEIRQDYKDYQENEQGVAHRIIHRRVPITTNESLSDSDIKDIKNYCHQYGTRCGVFDRNTGDFYMSTPSGMVKQNYYELKKKYPERFNFKDSLEEGAKTFLRDVDKENEPHTFTHKNRFNYDIKQVRTNPEDKTYEIGQFSYATPRHTTHNGRDFDRTVQALRDRGYSEKKKEECVKEDLNKDSIYQYMVFSKDGDNVLEAGPIELNSEEELQDAINNAKDLIAKENVGFILFKGDKIYFNSNEDKPITEGRLPQSPYSHFKNYQRGFNRRTSNKGYKIPLSDRRKEDNDIERRAYRSVRDDIKNQAGEDSIKLAQIAKEKEDEYSKAYNTDSTPENSGKALAAGHLRMSADDYNRLHKLNK